MFYIDNGTEEIEQLLAVLKNSTLKRKRNRSYADLMSVSPLQKKGGLRK
jgi:hypothetical protein